MATTKALRRRIVLPAFSQDSLRLSSPRTIRTPRIRPNAEHVHLLLTPAPGVTLERAIQFIKGGYSHTLGAELGRKAEVWQRGFTDHRIRDAEDFDIHRAYIHQNPFKRGLVSAASDYRYCSAFPGFKLDGWPSAAKAA